MQCHARQLGLALLVLVAGCGGSAKFPSDLEAVEASAEGTFDRAIVGDFPAARTMSGDLSAAWSKYRPRARRDKAPPAAVDAIDGAVAALPTKLAGSPNAIDAARAVNAVSAPMSQLYALYHPPVPVDVLDLDYLGREVLLDALGPDLARAGRDVDRIASTWSALEPKVAAAGGAAEIAQMQSTIANARAAITAGKPADLEAVARAELEAVDAIEAVFAAHGEGRD